MKMLKRFLQRWLEIPVTVAPVKDEAKKKDKRCGVPDVPRTAMGWPVFEPKYFTLPQLVLEARGWRNGAPGTVAAAEWKKYTDELIRRGYSTRLEIDNDFLPHEVPRKTEPDWLWQLKGL